jgi:CBS domain-containing membrane protein
MSDGEVGQRLLQRFRLTRRRWLSARLALSLYVFLNGFLAVGILSVLALLSHTPFVFPSVGPTAFLLYYLPTAPSSSPRNTLYGHAIGIACGYAALCVFGLQDTPSALMEGIHWPRVLTVALSLAATGGLMVLLDVVHAPAGATTMIVSLGIITSPMHLGTIELAVALLALQAFIVNRLAGIDYPVWSAERISNR